MLQLSRSYIFFFFNDTATTEIYTLSLHDALPISGHQHGTVRGRTCHRPPIAFRASTSSGYGTVTSHPSRATSRSEEHTSELQSRLHLVCRLLLEKKKKSYIECG